MRLTDRTVSELLQAFASPDPTPGGGSAAALSGAIGSALLAMVSGLRNPALTDAADAARLAERAAHYRALSEQLAALVNRDSEAYDEVVLAFRMPKGTDDEKKDRTAAIQAALRGATETPLAVMRACGEAIRESGIVQALGNPNASSDVEVAREMLGAGLRGARLNVEINLGSLKDAAFVAAARAEAARLADEATAVLAQANAPAPPA